MKTLDNVKETLVNLFSVNGDGWVIRQNVSRENIETCNGVAKADEKTKTCLYCVALNKTVFLNNKKPEYLHYNCKCKQIPYQLMDVKVDFPMKKIKNYLFVDVNKREMMSKMGYEIADSDYLYEVVYNAAKEGYLNGKYEFKEYDSSGKKDPLKGLNQNGQHFLVNFILPGTRNHTGEVFACHIGCVAWPYGTVKVATPVIINRRKKDEMVR